MLEFIYRILYSILFVIPTLFQVPKFTTQIHQSSCKVVNIYGILWYYHCPPTNRERSITFLNSETLFQVSGVSARDRLASQQQGHPQEQGSLPERSRLSH